MENDFRYDLVGLSTEEKPFATKAGTKLSDGSTYYEVDTGTFYILYNGIWYEQE